MSDTEEQNGTRPFRPWERPANGGAAPDDYDAPSTSSGNTQQTNDVPLKRKLCVPKRSRQVKSTLGNNEDTSDDSDSSDIETGADGKSSDPTPESAEDWVNKQTEQLIKLFPNTDPTYLREKCVEFQGSVDVLNKFASEKLEKNDMPTREYYVKRMELEKTRLRYTDNFSAEEYLKSIPDPWKYFGDKDRECVKFKDQSLWYLKTKFRSQYVRTINKVLKKNNYNMYLSYRELLRKKNNSRRRPRSDADCSNNRPTTIDIPFLQEMAFVENEALLTNYRNTRDTAKRKKLMTARKNGGIVECQCCFDNEVVKDDAIYCPKDHPFCKPCVTKYVEVEMGQGRCKFLCMSSCDEEIPLETLQKALAPELYSKVFKLVQMEEIMAANIEDLVHCPYCNYAAIMPPEITVFVCLNPDCLKESCRLCKEPNHVPLKCDEIEKSDEVRMRTYIENKMTEALVRTCYKCNKMFVKEEGCNKMVCSCGAKMCYICRQPVTNYTHFNGQGGTDYSKCPLYTSNDELHVDVVQRVGEQAKAEILEANPNKTLKHDPTLILPERTYDEPMPGGQANAAAGMGNGGFDDDDDDSDDDEDLNHHPIVPHFDLQVRRRPYPVQRMRLQIFF